MKHADVVDEVHAVIQIPKSGPGRFKRGHCFNSEGSEVFISVLLRRFVEEATSYLLLYYLSVLCKSLVQVPSYYYLLTSLHNR